MYRWSYILALFAQGDIHGPMSLDNYAFTGPDTRGKDNDIAHAFLTLHKQLVRSRPPLFRAPSHVSVAWIENSIATSPGLIRFLPTFILIFAGLCKCLAMWAITSVLRYWWMRRQDLYTPTSPGMNGIVENGSYYKTVSSSLVEEGESTLTYISFWI